MTVLNSAMSNTLLNTPVTSFEAGHSNAADSEVRDITKVIRTGAAGRPNQAASTDNISNRVNSEKIRLVSAGLKINKTSKNDNETGTIRAYYARTGMNLNVGDTIASFLDEKLQDNDYKKSYFAQEHEDIMYVNYKPTNQTDVEQFSNGSIYTTDYKDIDWFTDNLEEVISRIPYSHGPEDYMDLLVDKLAPSVDCPHEAALVCSTLEVPHSVIIVIEQASADVGFSFEMVRHFEYKPTADTLGYESKICQLDQYDTVFSLIRKGSLDFHGQERSVIFDDSSFIMGLWSMPNVFKKGEDVYNLLKKAAKSRKARDILKRHLPKILSTLVGSIPGVPPALSTLSEAAVKSFADKL